MKLIKDGEIVPINRQFVERLEQSEPITNPVVPFDYLIEATVPQIHNRNLGVLINATDELEKLEPYLNQIDLVVIRFSSFSDGSGFSTSYRLRNLLGYRGEIWAEGNLISDQYSQAIQCGINAVLIEDSHLERQPLSQWQEALRDAPQPYRFENHMAMNISESKKNSPVPIHANDNISDEIDRLNRYFSNQPTDELMRYVLTGNKMGRLALVSSFGTQSSVLLHMAAKIDPKIQILSIDTGKLFPETLQFQNELAASLCLTNIKSVRQDSLITDQGDPNGDLWSRDNDACCDLRKVEPLKNELKNFDSWISGRKAFQGGARLSISLFERSGDHIKINPLASWTEQQIDAYINRFNLPVHPLVGKGFSSVGCVPCTSSTLNSHSSREGRWSGTEKTECGIHLFEGITANNNSNSHQRVG